MLPAMPPGSTTRPSRQQCGRSLLRTCTAAAALRRAMGGLPAYCGPLRPARIWLSCVALSGNQAPEHTKAPAHLADDGLLPAPRHWHVVVGVPLSVAHGVKPAGEVVDLQVRPRAESVPTCRAVGLALQRGRCVNMASWDVHCHARSTRDTKLQARGRLLAGLEGLHSSRRLTRGPQQ